MSNSTNGCFYPIFAFLSSWLAIVYWVRGVVYSSLPPTALLASAVEDDTMEIRLWGKMWSDAEVSTWMSDLLEGVLSVAERWGRAWWSLGYATPPPFLISEWEFLGEIPEPSPGSRFASSWLLTKSVSRSTGSMSSLGAVLPTPESRSNPARMVTPSI